jgi:hypothetical protein
LEQLSGRKKNCTLVLRQVGAVWQRVEGYLGGAGRGT